MPRRVPKAERVAGQLVVCRIPDLNPANKGRATHLVRHLGSTSSSRSRARVVGIVSNEAFVIRLVARILTDTNDEWITDERRYRCEGTMTQLYPDRESEPVPVLTGGTV